mmetsp:Transcript_26696/g.57410  ORF Transcript_26696/g.57410 Transcript_26696/m.57410 type:complete len:335 (-) Transcript_26696:253-1257(-)
MYRQPPIIIMLMNHPIPMLRILNNMRQQLGIPRMTRVMRAIAPRTLLLVCLVRPSRFPFLLRIFSSPLERFETAIDDVGGESAVVVEASFDAEHGVVVFVFFGVEAVIRGVAYWFKVDEDIGIIPSLQRKRPSMQHTMALIQNHLPRLHRNIIRPTIMSINLQRPRFIHILRHIDNRTSHQRQTIDMRGKDGSGSVLSNSVERGGCEFLSGPFLEGVAGHFPDCVFEVCSGAGEFFVVYGEHPGWAFPVISISIPSKPLLHLLPPLIILPKFLNHLKNLRGRFHFGKPQLGIIHHARRLHQIHTNTIILRLIARIVIVMTTCFHEGVVKILSVA